MIDMHIDSNISLNSYDVKTIFFTWFKDKRHKWIKISTI